jgi:hypothetical protein
MKKVLILALLVVIGSGELMAKRIDRGLGNPKSVYIPKGTFSIGAAGGFNRFNANGENLTSGASLAGLVTNLNGNATLWDASLNGYWFFQKNMALGVRLGYNNVSADVNNLKVLSTLEFSNKHIVNSMFTGAIAYRAYIPLFNSKVVALFGETRLTGGFGYGKDYANSDRGKVGTYSDLYSVSLGLYPGISFFVMDFISVEVSLPLLEGGYEWNLQIEGQAHESDLSHAFFNYKPSLLGLNLGIIFHF